MGEDPNTDVEGHRLSQVGSDQVSSEEPDVEGHQFSEQQVSADEPDVEGHMFSSDQVSADQVSSE